MTEKDAAALREDTDKFSFGVVRYVESLRDNISLGLVLMQLFQAVLWPSTANSFRDTKPEGRIESLGDLVMSFFMYIKMQ